MISEEVTRRLTARKRLWARSMYVFFALSCCLSELTSCTPALSDNRGTVEATTVDELWNRMVVNYLSEDLWTETNAYDAGHCLMVPLHAAFSRNDSVWQQQFSDHLTRFMSACRQEPDTLVTSRLDRLHYLYLASQFVVLCARSNRLELIPPGLTDTLYEEVESIWLRKPAWQWDIKPFAGGMRERVLWKLNNRNVPRSYERAIIDEELFVFAIASDLRAFETLVGRTSALSPIVADVVKTAFDVFRKEGEFQRDGGWLFQPGVWTDHPTYAYAGHEREAMGLEPAPLPGIAPDTSHSHRFPLWLTSLSSAYDPTEDERQFFDGVKAALEVQFFERVLVPPTTQFPAYRTRNYMDGTNGLYRWNESPAQKDSGYGPYELSGTFTMGWWAFLDSDRISHVYQQMGMCFPLPEEVVATYTGPNTLRTRHSAVQWPEFFVNGFCQLIVSLAGDLHSR